ncbi:hypothetical protein ZIOFF_065910 [Zingiber officinale]|uniref:Uncharacterized protein n=1 Tax=Zingiber officinale TaxID=94328 RepID=A0A8J5EY11_ZINOF|nr:hypothetical protein ZIOFF_065910 [Zingiber officinale]
MLALASESPIRCIIGELRSLGESHHEALEAAQQLMMARKKHEKRINTTTSIESVVGEPNSEHFFVATQDADMRKSSFIGDADETLLGSACPKKRMLGVSQRSQFIRKRAKSVSVNTHSKLKADAYHSIRHYNKSSASIKAGGCCARIGAGPQLSSTPVVEALLWRRPRQRGGISKETPLVSFFKHLTHIKMVERRAKDLYFNCDESYSTSHKCKCLMMTGKVRKRGKWIRKFSSMLLVVLYPTFELEDKLNIEESDDVDVEVDAIVERCDSWKQISYCC